MTTPCTACHLPITGVSPDVKVCGYDADVYHLACAIRVMGHRAFTVPSAVRVEAWKRGRR